MSVTATAIRPLAAVNQFVRADAQRLSEWAARPHSGLVWLCVGAIVTGSGAYGAAMGSWCEPMQAVYVALKLPFLILLTTIGNGLLNGMLAPLLGLRITFRQAQTAVLISFAIASTILGALSPVALFVVWNTPPLTGTQTAVLISFAIASTILGALSPVALFVVWNTPPLTGTTRPTSPEHSFLQLTLVAFIAFAGMVGNVRLLPLLKQWASRDAVAWRVLFAWLAGNLFLGSQICWVLRPFLWASGGHVQFIGPDCFHGSFYETVFNAARQLASH